jgi:hypothetical protein
MNRAEGDATGPGPMGERPLPRTPLVPVGSPGARRLPAPPVEPHPEAPRTLAANMAASTSTEEIVRIEAELSQNEVCTGSGSCAYIRHYNRFLMQNSLAA